MWPDSFLPQTVSQLNLESVLLLTEQQIIKGENQQMEEHNIKPRVVCCVRLSGRDSDSDCVTD